MKRLRSIESAGTLDNENLVELLCIKMRRDAFLSEKKRERLADRNRWDWG